MLHNESIKLESPCPPRSALVPAPALVGDKDTGEAEALAEKSRKIWQLIKLK